MRPALISGVRLPAHAYRISCHSSLVKVQRPCRGGSGAQPPYIEGPEPGCQPRCSLDRRSGVGTSEVPPGRRIDAGPRGAERLADCATSGPGRRARPSRSSNRSACRDRLGARRDITGSGCGCQIDDGGCVALPDALPRAGLPAAVIRPSGPVPPGLHATGGGVIRAGRKDGRRRHAPRTWTGGGRAATRGGSAAIPRAGFPGRGG